MERIEPFVSRFQRTKGRPFMFNGHKVCYNLPFAVSSGSTFKVQVTSAKREPRQGLCFGCVNCQMEFGSERAKHMVGWIDRVPYTMEFSIVRAKEDARLVLDCADQSLSPHPLPIGDMGVIVASHDESANVLVIRCNAGVNTKKDFSCVEAQISYTGAVLIDQPAAE